MSPIQLCAEDPFGSPRPSSWSSSPALRKVPGPAALSNGHPLGLLEEETEISLGHVYMVLEPVGSARLTFGDNLYYKLCVFMYLR